MDSQTSFALISTIQEKLASVKKQLQIQTLHSGSLKTQIESLKSDFDALELMTGAKSITNESIKSTLGALSRSVESTYSLIDSTSSMLESLRISVESLSPSSGSTTLSGDSIKGTNESLRPSDGSITVSGGSITLSGEALDISAGLKTIIIKGTQEKLKRVFYFDTIPARLAGIVLAISKSQKLRVPEMMDMFYISRNTAVRDLFLLKKLGLVKFSGGNRNGYFLLSEEGEKILNTLGS